MEFDKSKWYLLTWSDDAPYKVSSVYLKEGDPDSLLLAMTDPYGGESMLAVTRKDFEEMKEFKRPETDSQPRLSADKALSPYGYCARYLDRDEVLPKEGGTPVERDYKRTKEQHVRYRTAVLNGWDVPSWQAWKTIVCC